MYGIGGEHDLTERELPHLAWWRNSRPVPTRARRLRPTTTLPTPRLSTSALIMRTVADQATLVVQIVFTAASKTVGVRSIRPDPAAAHERSGSSATSA